MTPEPKNLDPTLRALLDGERADDLVPAEAKARVLGRVLGTVGAAVAAHAGGSTEPTGRPASAGVRAAGPLASIARPLSLAVALGAGAVAGAAGWNALRPPPRERVVYVDRVVPPPPAPVASAPASPAPAPVPEPVRPPPPRGAAPRTAADDLAAERRLLDAARASLGSGDPERALVSLRKHERGYRDGQLVEEREALAIEALVLVGRTDEARAREARFRTRYPTSVMLPAIEAALPSGAPSSDRP